MLSREQKRVLRYVEEGCLLKLKSFLRRHPGVRLSFASGKRRRSPLHVACSLCDDAVLRLLLEGGAEPLQRDRRGDTPLHVAARRALKRGKRAYDDLVVPLQRRCPVAMETPNDAGVTPADLLRLSKERHVCTASRLHESAPEHRPEKADLETEWREKLLDECQQEFLESFGQYDGDFLWDEAELEDFDRWADRIRQEYSKKQRAANQRNSDGERRTRAKRAHKERRDVQAELEREHATYLERAARKEQETLSGKKRRYEEMCAVAFSSESDSQLSYADIPWPAPCGSVEDMVAVMLHGANRSDTPTFRRLLRHQQTLWHPDKFAQRCGNRLKEADRKRILDTVTALSQELNRLSQCVR